MGRGEFVSILGHSGVGKSTLLHIIGSLDHPSSGQVLAAGQDVFSLPPRELDRYRNRQVGFVFQFHHLLADCTALENVMLPALAARLPPREARSRSLEILSEMGLADRLDHVPGKLSGGEQQRVAVARALVMSPGILLADEPTGNLDAETSQSVFEILLRVVASRGLTVVMVTHNQDLATSTDRILTLAGGILVPGAPGPRSAQ
jgi:lipoprotein-releasing system ATP-binding protein